MSTDDYVAVPFSPRPPPIEFVPPSPAKDALWVEGSWEWVGNRYAWHFGSWVVPPKGAMRARWTLVRRKEDGQLFFAPSSWRDESGKPVADTGWGTALGPNARARSRLGGPAAEEIQRGGPGRGEAGGGRARPEPPAGLDD